MITHPAKRIEILIEAPMQGRLTRALMEAGASGWTALPVLGGDGRSGPWSRDGQVGPAGGVVCVVCLVAVEDADRLLEAAFAVLSPYIGLVNVSDAQVVRAERFRQPQR